MVEFEGFKCRSFSQVKRKGFPEGTVVFELERSVVCFFDVVIGEDIFTRTLEDFLSLLEEGYLK
jgi:hypothetical protein